GAPLWNHEISVATYTPYPSGGTMNSSPGAPSAQSILCLSCHDGTVALDSYGGATGSTHLTLDSTTYVGTDLRDDHPISITYDAALAVADGSLFNPITINSSLGGTIDADLLFGHQVQCASCHDVHGVTGTTNLLRITNDGSELCLNCHNK
ncbi:MAG: cytochrome c3 family protein, partial [Bacteroidota bacterium]